MTMRDTVNYTHSAVEVSNFCGFNKRGYWWLQYPGPIERGEVRDYIKRRK